MEWCEVGRYESVNLSAISEHDRKIESKITIYMKFKGKKQASINQPKWLAYFKRTLCHLFFLVLVKDERRRSLIVEYHEIKKLFGMDAILWGLINPFGVCIASSGQSYLKIFILKR